MGEYWLRWALGILVMGGVGVLLTRMVAHWTDQDAWVVRGVCYAMIILGDIGVMMWVPGLAWLKILAVAVPICAIMVWLDITCDRKEAEMEAERIERLFKNR